MVIKTRSPGRGPLNKIHSERIAASLGRAILEASTLKIKEETTFFSNGKKSDVVQTQWSRLLF